MKAIHWFLSLVLLASIGCAHFVSRSDFHFIFALYTIAFSGYFILVFGKSSIPLQIGLLLGLLCRLTGFFSEPLLSDDYFRFIWDGYVMHQGFNPASITPAEMNAINPSSELSQLYLLLNSPDYFSVYPPVLQLIFYVSHFLNGLDLDGHIIFYKTVLLCADIIIIFFLSKILRLNKLPGHLVLIYALNPLVILEYMGNLHMDSIMIAFLLTALFYIQKKNFIAGSVLLALSISTKMLSLLFLPFLPLKKFSKEYFTTPLLTLTITTVLFYVFFQNQTGWLQSIALWFRQFEFNACVYYVVQKLYAAFKGYEDIRFVGPVMAGLTVIGLALLWLWSLRKNIHWSMAMAFSLSFYFLMSTTLHPWYLGMLLCMAIISGFIFPVVWTYVAFLSYSHYHGGGFAEDYVLITTEYALLFLFTMFELRWRGWSFFSR